jgi:hypothetical protein
MKSLRLFTVVICLMFITNLQAQTMSKFAINISYHYNEEDMTATIVLKFNPSLGVGESGNNNIVIPDYVEKDGEKYTVITWRSSVYEIGWDCGASSTRPPRINVYIPKTLKKIESKAITRRSNTRTKAEFWFYFENKEVCDYLNEYYGSIAELQNIMYWGAYKTEDFELEQEWFVVDYDYHIGCITQWNRVHETNIQNVNVSNVNYRIDNNTIYFDETVNNIQLYDLQGRLLYHNNLSSV